MRFSGMYDEESSDQRLDRVNGRVLDKGGISPQLQYAARYWGTHLELSVPSEITPYSQVPVLLTKDSSPVVNALVVQFFRSPQFAYWLENAAFLQRDPITSQISCAGRYFANLANGSVLVNHAEEKCDEAKMDETTFCSDVSQFWMQNSVAVQKHPGSLYACLGCWVCRNTVLQHLNVTVTMLRTDRYTYIHTSK